jgi:hypothetical protein
MHAGAKGHVGSDGGVQLTGSQAGLERLELEILHGEARVGSLLYEQRQQARHEHELDDVGHAEPEHLVDPPGREGRPFQVAGEPLEQRAHHDGERLRPRRGRHVAAVAHEERIVERDSQAGERVAHRRLREEHTPRRPRHVALGHERVEDHQQVEVELRNIHGVHAPNANNALQ